MTGNDIRSKFLDYFAGQGHRIVRSSSLVPADDPTLLFTNAGMNQFKEVFLGLEKRDYSRASSSQKCVRAGGKHNDLDNVGYTRRHLTFFEMLGNFSFGDYFKKDAIAFAWELVTGANWFGLPKDKLYVTVFREDDDAEQLWQRVAGVSKDRIFRLDEKDNFWQMGDTGPCGPCSEIHFDLGPNAAAPGREHEQFPSDAGDRFVEIWNLVFMQYDRANDGTLTPLPKPSIDTGMGLDRVTAVLQGKVSVYDTDLLGPIIERAAELLRVEIHASERTDIALRINADHARATAFLIHDGVLPSNDGRGYVLRKIMRRAMRNGRLAGATEPYLHKLTGFVADLMKPAYPELEESTERVARIVREEENRYATTFQVAERFFQDEAKSAANGVLPGSAAFKLYDTYGLALDEQEEMAREFGLGIDREGFEAEMEKQRVRARASWKGADKAQIAEAYKNLPPAQFVGREKLETLVQIHNLIVNKSPAALVERGSAEAVFPETPFYAESGGQIGDTGLLLDPETRERVAVVEAAYKPTPSAIVHKIHVLKPIQTGQKLIGVVDSTSRSATMRNHTATHLLHAALRQVLGTHVKQAGSVVEPSRLRFDFTHYSAMTKDELREVERLVNQRILENTEVMTDIMDLDQALATGAMALFGEKYGQSVRVVSIPGFSRELCGGTHVHRTGDIGLFKIIYEGSISAGIRRIEAITGEGALERFQQASAQLSTVSGLFRTTEDGVLEQVEKLLEQHKIVERQRDQLKSQMAQRQGEKLPSRMVNGTTIVAETVEGMDRDQLRALADSLRNKAGSAVVVIASVSDSTIALVSAVSKDLTGKVHAGKLVREVAAAIGGKGGGRPDMAEGAGKDIKSLPGALESVYQKVEGLLQ
ncbi:MAG: alanine--tRNA ligase [Acidobacteriaceae bacterium]|nr:alanine--tRNA ligase [Acidobacteriaceae bacterium]MBV9780686.1 alanine--tRNA ligase [Acidobacteriaceae bacterium]